VGIQQEIDRFLSRASFAETTRRSYRGDLAHFARWLESRRLELDDVGDRKSVV